MLVIQTSVSPVILAALPPEPVVFKTQPWWQPENLSPAATLNKPIVTPEIRLLAVALLNSLPEAAAPILPEIGAFFTLAKAHNGALAKAQTFGALSANPTLILDFYESILKPNVKATDSKGNEFSTESKEEYSL